MSFGVPLAPNTGSLRTDLIEVLKDCAAVLDEPHGRALRRLVTQRPETEALVDEVLLPLTTAPR
ncbi:hypothetical protein ACFUN8_19700 [Streptomyces sp. NPDC057307]|uniref:hypothetical protein n=1 Tax=Streptomyces sp. NPDC057307 TaxID=3346096 RepID=UPI003643397D